MQNKLHLHSMNTQLCEASYTLNSVKFNSECLIYPSGGNLREQVCQQSVQEQVTYTHLKKQSKNANFEALV